MTATDIRFIQENLKKEKIYFAKVDGARGAKTSLAIDIAISKRSPLVPRDWTKWSYNRKLVAYIQLLAYENNIETGKIDGFLGPQAENAMQYLKIFLKTGVLPRGFDEITPIESNPHNFPKESEEELIEYYGKPCEIILQKVRTPWELKLDWDLKTQSNIINIHEKLADSLAEILERAYDHYRLKGIRELGLNRFGGSYNCRKRKGSVRTVSTHAWGIAIDWFPSKNKPHWDHTKASLANGDLDFWWELWEKEGWVSLGRSENRDWMHIQGAKR